MKHSGLLMSIHDYAQSNPQKIAIIEGDNLITYSQLWDNSKRAAHFLYSKGIMRGDKIVLSAIKDIRFVYIYLGAQLLGVINTLVDSGQNINRLNYIEEEVNPKICFGYKSSNNPSVMFHDIDLSEYETTDTFSDEVRSNDIAEILFTTGTTGSPKGVCLSYANIFGSACNINGFIGNDNNDVEILALPICHSFGMGRLRCNLICGATIVLLGSFANVRSFVESIDKYNATGFAVVPAAWTYIRKISGKRLEKYSSKIKYIEIGSAAMPKDVKMEMLGMFPQTRICMHYGLTEASRSTFIEFHDSEHINSIGRPSSDKVEIRIYDHKGNILPSGKTGEICVRGNMVMSGYLNTKDNNNAFIDGYFRTGDNGYMDDDGYVYLLGREKEMINVGGKKVSPMEVEDAICSLGVGDCICVPMPDPDGILGEVVKCYILEGTTKLSFDEISERLSSMLETYKRPVEYDWINEIPVTSSGKKQRILIKGKGHIKIRPKNGLYYRTYEELKNNTDLGYDDDFDIMSTLDENQKQAILNKPTGYNKEEICQILVIDDNKVVGTQMCYTSRVVIDNNIIICNHASSVYSHPDYRAKGTGGLLLMALTKLKPWRNTITGGNSQLSLPIFQALRYSCFEFPRFIVLHKSRSVIQRAFHTESRACYPLCWIIDKFLGLQKYLFEARISKYAKQLVVEKTDNCPKEVENIVMNDGHRFKEAHDISWFDWNLKYDFTPDNRKSKGLYLVKDKDMIVGFFVNKVQFYEQASSRGFRNVLLGSVMEWGIKKDVCLSEYDIQMLAMKSMPKNVDGIQLATDDLQVAHMFKMAGAFRLGNANMCVKLRSIKDSSIKEAIKDPKNWRLRLACNDTLID